MSARTPESTTTPESTIPVSIGAMPVSSCIDESSSASGALDESARASVALPSDVGIGVEHAASSSDVSAIEARVRVIA
ncbi:MAG: hypothetical protein U0269_13730 [Polyangiales bacterium]